MPAQPSRDPTLGRIGAFQLLKRLSTGGTSDVLLARAEGPHGFERTVVLKRLLSEHQDDEFGKMFAREAAAYARLAHPAIVKLFDFFENEEQLVMVLEYVDGVSLARLLNHRSTIGRPLPDAACLWIGARVFDALSAAHTARDPMTGEFTTVIHRDVNPSNVLVPWDGYVKLADFGIAKIAGFDQETQAGVVKGTFGYMAPEQVRGERVTIRSDVYSAALVLWELLTHRRAFPDAEKLPEMEILRRMAEPKLDALDALRADLPLALREAMRRALEPNPDKRSVTAEEMYSVLSTVVDLDQARQTLVLALKPLKPQEASGATAIVPEILLRAAPARTEGSATVVREDSAALKLSEQDFIVDDASSTREMPAVVPSDARLPLPQPTPPPAPVAPIAPKAPNKPTLLGVQPREPSHSDLQQTLVIPPKPARPGETTISLPFREPSPTEPAKAERPAPPKILTPVSVPAKPFGDTLPLTPAPVALPPATPAPKSSAPPPPPAPFVPKSSAPPAPSPFASAPSPFASAPSPFASAPPFTTPSAPPGAPQLPPRADEGRRGPAIVLIAVAATFVAVVAGFALVYVGYTRKPDEPTATKPSATVTTPAKTASATASATATQTATASPTTTASATQTATTATASAVPSPTSDVAEGEPRPTPSAGLVRLPARAEGHRIFIDDKVVGHDQKPILVACGKHEIKVGSADAPKEIDVPCNGTISVR